MSDDVEAATHKLLIGENSEFDIVFPGVGDIGSPGTQDPFTFLYLSIDVNYSITKFLLLRNLIYFSYFFSYRYGITFFI